MNKEQLAGVLYDALHDKKDVVVLRQPITRIEKETEKYYLKITDRKYTISKAFALNAIAWGVKLITLPVQYQLGNVKFSI